jgi:hypothetical protein
MIKNPKPPTATLATVAQPPVTTRNGTRVLRGPPVAAAAYSISTVADPRDDPRRVAVYALRRRQFLTPERLN